MSEPMPDVSRRPVQVSAYVHERLFELAEAYQREERLPKRPTVDDVIRRLLAARDELAGRYGGQP